MAQFFFHLTGAGPVIRDQYGLALPSLAAATYAARATLARHALDAALAGQPFPETAAIEICDESGDVLDIEWCWCLLRNPAMLQADTPTSV